MTAPTPHPVSPHDTVDAPLPAGPWAEWQRRRRHLRTARVVLMGAGLLAGVGLIAVGATVAGAIIGGLALLRGVTMLVVTRSNGHGRRGIGPSRAGSVPPPGAVRPDRRPVQRLARRELGVAARAMGMSIEDLHREQAAGRSIAEVARQRSVPVELVVDAVSRDATAVVARVGPARPRGVAGGAGPERIGAWATHFVERAGGRPGGPGGRRPDPHVR